MNATRFALLKRDVAEAFQVTDLNDFDTFALLVGRVTVLLLAAFLLWGIAHASYRFARKHGKGWLKRETPPDIPDFLQCSCPKVTNTAGYTLVLEQHPNPKCVFYDRTPKETA